MSNPTMPPASRRPARPAAPRDPRAWRWPSCGAALLAAGVVAVLAWPGGPVHAPATEPNATQPAASPPAEPGLDRRDRLGITAARQRLADATPTGRGIDFAHVEGSPGHYLPHVNNRVFRGVTITPRSGASKPFNHAHGTAKTLYGPSGLAPGVTDVSAYTTAGWMRDVLRLTSALPPAEVTPRVHTHSWIAPDAPYAQEALQRTDHLVDTHNRLVVAGVNNGRDTPIPALLASSYNAIAVGTASGDGASSAGPTGGAWPGRAKPDLVGADGLTSFATPQVAAVVARLVEATGDLPFYVEHAEQAEVIKAVLLAGASKPWGWRQAGGRPLHDRYGAGVAHLDNSLKILQGGPATRTDPAAAENARPAGPFGWWFGTLPPGGHASLRVAAEAGAGPLSVVAVWHRRVDGETVLTPEAGAQRAEWRITEGLADFDLLARVQTAGSGDDGRPATTMLGLSRSRVDNVEHVFVPSLPGEPGEPSVVWLDLIRPRGGGRGTGQTDAWDVALAWRIGGWDPDDGPAGTP
ncbi:MAG: hypothetical protein AAF586_04215 [Planctomycetota bacterium]